MTVINKSPSQSQERLLRQNIFCKYSFIGCLSPLLISSTHIGKAGNVAITNK